MEEKQLIALAQSGDPSAFQRIYELHHKHVLNRCRQMLRNESEAEDVSQEVFLLLWQKIHLFRYQSAFASWLFTLTTNKVISHMRKIKIKSSVCTDLIPENGQMADQHNRLEIMEVFENLTEMEKFCLGAEMEGNSVRHNGGAVYLRSAARQMRTGFGS